MNSLKNDQSLQLFISNFSSACLLAKELLEKTSLVKREIEEKYLYIVEDLTLKSLNIITQITNKKFFFEEIQISLSEEKISLVIKQDQCDAYRYSFEIFNFLLKENPIFLIANRISKELSPNSDIESKIHLCKIIHIDSTNNKYVLYKEKNLDLENSVQPLSFVVDSSSLENSIFMVYFNSHTKRLYPAVNYKSVDDFLIREFNSNK